MAGTQGVLPKFEKSLLVSLMLVAPTVITEGARAGEKFLLSLLSLPAPSTQEEHLVQRYSFTISTSSRTCYNVDTEADSICNGLIERRSSITDDLAIAVLSNLFNDTQVFIPKC